MKENKVAVKKAVINSILDQSWRIKKKAKNKKDVKE